MKSRKWIFWLAVILVVFFQGCATTKKMPSEMLKEAETKLTPVATTTIAAVQPEKIVSPPEIIRAEKAEGPAELTTIKKAEVRIIYDPSLNKTAGPVSLSRKQSVVKAQAQAQEKELFPYAHSETIWLRTFNTRGKAVEGSVPAGTLILYKCVEDEKTQIKTCVPEVIAQCGNRVDKFRLEFYPAKQVWTERYRDKEILKTTEWYRDTTMVTVVKKIILPPPPPKKVEWERPKEIDYGGGNGGGGGGGGCSGSGASR